MDPKPNDPKPGEPKPNDPTPEERELEQRREESAWVTVARYSEIGFMIPAAVMVGYFLGRVGDYYLHLHGLYLLGIILGAVAGFVSMIRRALESSREDVDGEDGADGKGGDGSNDKR